jgi:thiamine biosynthesis lipoprotein
LGTFVEITVPEKHEQAAEQAFAAIAHVHNRMSFHESSSDLARLRAAIPGKPVKVDRETVAVLRMASELHLATGGLFDVAVGRTLVRNNFLPREGVIHLNRFAGTTADIEILDDDHVCCHRRVLIDLGGIAKGHAVDLAVHALLSCGVPKGLVNAGGDLRAFGEHDWPVGLRDADGEVRFMIPARDCAVATSSNLTTRRRANGAIHSPHIGHARDSILVDHRVTIVAETCIVADALTKIALADPGLAVSVIDRYGARLIATPDAGVPT